MLEKGISEEAREVMRDNVADAIENGPRLSYGRGICVLARNSLRQTVLLGGLGGMGVGQMWVGDSDNVKRYAGYDEAPEKPEGSYFNQFTGRWVESEKPW